VDPSLAYTPPSACSVPADYDVEFGEFDYDAIKADERTRSSLGAYTQKLFTFSVSTRVSNALLFVGLVCDRMGQKVAHIFTTLVTVLGATFWVSLCCLCIVFMAVSVDYFGS
jgi:hypothetical protein